MVKNTVYEYNRRRAMKLTKDVIDATVAFGKAFHIDVEAVRRQVEPYVKAYRAIDAEGKGIIITDEYEVELEA